MTDEAKILERLIEELIPDEDYPFVISWHMPETAVITSYEDGKIEFESKVVYPRFVEDAS